MSLLGYLIYSNVRRGVYYVFIVFEKSFVEGYSPSNLPHHSNTHYFHSC